MRIRRRQVLSLASGLSASALLPSTLLGGCAPAPARAPDRQLLRRRVKNVVVLMMENRSFDHIFGSLSLLEGRTAVDGLQPDMHNLLSDGTRIGLSPADPFCVADPGHNWEASHRQYYGYNNVNIDSGIGDCSGFAENYARAYGQHVAHQALSYLTRDDQPASYRLADNYALCQRWFASVMGPTWPNRYYAHWGTSGGNRDNNGISEPLPTVFSRLDEAGIAWKNYYGVLPFSSLYPYHSVEQPEYARLDAFFDDAAQGTLPPVVWLDPVYGRNDDHPPAHPMAGQLLIASVFEALRQSPQWQDCIFVLTYDEHGGFYDHVKPPLGPDARADAGFAQRGFRVPTIVAGPYVNPAVVDVEFDHTSIIKSLCELFDLDPLGERDDKANAIWSVLDEERLWAGDASPGMSMPPIAVDAAVLADPACVAVTPFHLGGSAITGQPELEAAFEARYGTQHDKDLRRRTAETMQLLAMRAKALGVLS